MKVDMVTSLCSQLTYEGLLDEDLITKFSDVIAETELPCDNGVAADLSTLLDDLTPAKRTCTDETNAPDRCASIKLLKGDFKIEKY